MNKQNTRVTYAAVLLRARLTYSLTHMPFAMHRLIYFVVGMNHSFGRGTKMAPVAASEKDEQISRWIGAWDPSYVLLYYYTCRFATQTFS